MSKTWTPSQLAGTVWPSHVRALVFLEFHERTRMSPHTTMSPWSPLQRSCTISRGFAGEETSMMRNPS